MIAYNCVVLAGDVVSGIFLFWIKKKIIIRLAIGSDVVLNLVRLLCRKRELEFDLVDNYHLSFTYQMLLFTCFFKVFNRMLDSMFCSSLS